MPIALHYVQDLQPSDARCTLGAILAPDGTSSSQMKLTIQKAKEFFGKFVNSSLSQKAKWTAISVIEPALLYPLVNTLYYGWDVSILDSITSQMKCIALGLN